MHLLNTQSRPRITTATEELVLLIIAGSLAIRFDLRDLREPMSQRGAAVVAIGTAAPIVHDALDGVVPVLDAGSMREAVNRAYEAARPQGVVLLAPACASFDWFRDYAERGETFKAEVARLVEASKAGIA